MHLPFSAIGVVVLLNAAASASPALTADDKNTAILAARQVADTTTAKKACTNRIVQQKLHALCRLTLTQYAFMGCDYSKGPLPGFLKGALAPYSNQVIVEACAAALGTTVPVCGLPSPSAFKYCMSRHCDCTQSTDKRTVTCHYYTSITKRSDETFNEAIFDVFNVPPYSPGGTLYIEAAGGSSGSASGALLYGSFGNTRSGQVKLAVGATVRNSRIGAGPDGGSGSTASNSFDTVKMPAAIGGGGSTTIDCKSVNGAACYVVAAGAGGSGQSHDSDGTTILESPGTDADSAPDDTYLENGRRGGSGAPGQGSGGGGGGYRGGRAGSSQRGGSSSGGRGGRTGGTGGRSFGPSSVTKDLCAYPSTSGARFGARCGEAYVSYSI